MCSSDLTPACVIVKHANPCGVAVAEGPLQAYQKAFQTDPTSAFGGIIAFNRPLDQATAEAVSKQFVEVLIAPAYSDEALAVLQAALREFEAADPINRQPTAACRERLGPRELVRREADGVQDVAVAGLEELLGLLQGRDRDRGLAVFKDQCRQIGRAHV